MWFTPKFGENARHFIVNSNDLVKTQNQKFRLKSGEFIQAFLSNRLLLFLNSYENLQIFRTSGTDCLAFICLTLKFKIQ